MRTGIELAWWCGRYPDRESNGVPRLQASEAHRNEISINARGKEGFYIKKYSDFQEKKADDQKEEAEPHEIYT
jgi:hypothetical protein